MSTPDQLGDGPCLLLADLRKQVERLMHAGKTLAEIANRAETPYGTLSHWRHVATSGDALALEKAICLLRDWQ